MKLVKTLLIPPIFLLFLQPCFAFADDEIQKFQLLLRDKPMGERIAFRAEKFIGIPYDMDPLGEYISMATIVADGRVLFILGLFIIKEMEDRISRNFMQSDSDPTCGIGWLRRGGRAEYSPAPRDRQWFEQL